MYWQTSARLKIVTTKKMEKRTQRMGKCRVKILVVVVVVVMMTFFDCAAAVDGMNYESLPSMTTRIEMTLRKRIHATYV